MLAAIFDASQHLATGASKGAEYVTNQIIPVIRANTARTPNIFTARLPHVNRA
jgi:hypothetical protein